MAEKKAEGGHVFLGPAHQLEHPSNGKTYVRGEKVPLSEEELRLFVRRGQQFQGVNVDAPGDPANVGDMMPLREQLDLGVILDQRRIDAGVEKAAGIRREIGQRQREAAVKAAKTGVASPGEVDEAAGTAVALGADSNRKG
jgi:hypothetical protein